MAGKASRENGKKGGRPPARKNDATIMKEAALEEFQKLVKERMSAIFYAQFQLAMGVQHLFRIDETPRGGKEHVLVTDPNEIGDILAQMHEGRDEGGVYNDNYYYISVKAPDNSALNSMLDRAYGRAQQKVDHTTKGKELPRPILYGLHSDDDAQEDQTA